MLNTKETKNKNITYIPFTQFLLLSIMGTSSSSSKTRSMTDTKGPCILVTGGCGYIGSHTITCLLQSPLNYSVVVVDNLSNSSSKSLDRVSEICELDEETRKERLVFHNVDMCDKDAFRKVFEASPQFDACIHFAGLKVRMLLNAMKNNDQNDLFSCLTFSVITTFFIKLYHGIHL
jgi:FlaA1/EpsC-like NDP-sugar epimerase